MEGQWKFLGGGEGLIQAKILQAKYEVKLGMCGGVWILSGTVHLYTREKRDKCGVKFFS